MKTVLFNLFIFATVFFLVSSALPRNRGEDHKNLLDSDTSLENGENPLQRRRPPVKIPGPKLVNPENLKTTPDDESKIKKISKKDMKLTKDNKHKNDDMASLDDDSKRGKKGKGKDKDLETQGERNSRLIGSSPQKEA